MSIDFLWICNECNFSNEMSDWKCISCKAAKSAESCIKMFQSEVCLNKSEKKEDCEKIVKVETNSNSDKSKMSVDQFLITKTIFDICDFIIKNKSKGVNEDDIFDNSRNIFNDHFEFHFGNCLKIDRILHLIDSAMFGSGGTRWRAAYDNPKEGDDVTKHNQDGIASNCGFFTFDVDDKTSNYWNEYDYCRESNREEH